MTTPAPRAPFTDLARAHHAIATLGLKGPHDPAGQGLFTWPKDASGRLALADAVYDAADRHAARAVLDAPQRMTTTWQPATPAPDEHAARALSVYLTSAARVRQRHNPRHPGTTKTA